MSSERFGKIIILTILCSASLAFHVPHAQPYLFADEAVYHAMTQSLVHDLDLVYDKDDLSRICSDFPSGPRGIILKKDNTGTISYAKPLLFPFCAMPFYALLHLNGFIVMNALCWWIVFSCLASRWGGGIRSILFAALALTFSAYTPYIVWFHPEILTSMILTVFVWNWIQLDTNPQTPISNRLLLYSGILLAAAATIKPQVIVLGVFPLWKLIARRKYSNIKTALIGFAGTVVLILVVSFILTGGLNPYSGNRKIFNDVFPLETDAADFDSLGNSWSTETAGFHFNTNVFLWNLLYFWIGRFSGLIPYFFPAFMAIVLAFKSYRDRHTNWVLISFSVMVLLQIVLIPSNYHGGGGALGNRYMVSLYPVVLMAIPKIPGKRTIIAIVIFAALFSAPLITSPFTASFYPGSHTNNAIYKHFPAEWTLTGSFPIFDPQYRRVAFAKPDTYYYFLDQFTSGKEHNGFWLQADTTAEWFVDAPEPIASFQFKAHENPVETTVQLKTSVQSIEWTQKPGELRDITISAGTGHEMIDIYGRPRWIYRFKADASKGAILKYQGIRDDPRYLSIFLEPLSTADK